MILALQTMADAVPPAGPQAPAGLSALFSGTPWIDVVGLCVVTLFLCLGIRHGLVWQVTRLIGMLVAVTLARSLSPELAPHFSEVLSLPDRACQGIVWFLVFLATLLVTAVIGMVGRRALEAVHLGPMDRMGGALAGAVTGVVVHSAFLVLLAAVGTQDWSTRTLSGSASANMLDSLSRKSHILLSASAAERIMEPWGQTYDMQRAQEQQIQIERTRGESLRRAEELRQRMNEEYRRAGRPAANTAGRGVTDERGYEVR